MPQQTRSRDLPTYAEVERRLTLQWDQKLDTKAAVQTANLLQLMLRTSPPDIRKHGPIVAHAAEVLWDTKHLAAARRLVEAWCRQVQDQLARDHTIDPFEPRIRCVILTARLEHRDKQYDLAFANAMLAWRRLQREAGGETALRELLRCPEPTLLGELACAVLAIALPAGRVLLKGRPTLRAQMLDPLVAEALALVSIGDLPPKYERTHALVNQTFFAIGERRNRHDLPTLRRLARLDEMFRPRHARGQSTRRLLDLVFTQIEGSTQDEVRLAETISDDLLRAGLIRHIEALSERGWWRRSG